MNDLHSTLSTVLPGRYYTNLARVRELAAPLDEKQFWTKPYAYGNSFGHLVLHLTGNLDYYIGAQIAGTGYVRDRPREFSEAARPSKESVLKAFDEAVALVARTIGSQLLDEWSAAYSAVGVDAQDRFEIVLQCATHLHHHIGQMMYLGFELKRTG